MKTKYILARYIIYVTVSIIIFYCFSGCKKLVSIPPPSSSITTNQVFSNNDEANSAIAGIYTQMINSQGIGFASGVVSIYTGASADELDIFSLGTNDFVQFQENDLNSLNNVIAGNYWSQAYTYIYGCNDVIEGLAASSAVDAATKSRLTGEAKFLRAFCEFYLLNFFGDIPLVNTTNWNKTNLLSRTGIADVYAQIIADLQSAQASLPADYNLYGGERSRVIKDAATAMLARAYLYLGQWPDAETQSTSVINNTGLFQLAISPRDAFDKNGSEAIWQLQQSINKYPFNATPEGKQLIPQDHQSQPYAYLTSQLLGAFEPGDLRREQWIDSTTYMGTQYFYPYKYNTSPNVSPDSAIRQYYMAIRFAEMYLIRAEARARQGKLSGTESAQSDLNFIRYRSGLPNTTAGTQSELIDAIIHERQVELFAEWGHRWLDLKRTHRSDAILQIIKQTHWQSSDTLYPIPLNELRTDPNLTQNPGY